MISRIIPVGRVSKEIWLRCKSAACTTFRGKAQRFGRPYLLGTALIGVLVDVSGSMRQSVQQTPNYSDDQLTRIGATISALLNIAQTESSSHTRREEDKIFAIAFGVNGDEDENTCDLFSLIENVKIPTKTDVDRGYDKLIHLLSWNGAPKCEQYIRKYLTKAQVAFFYAFFSQRDHRADLTELVKDLPRVCKNERGSGTMRAANESYKRLSDLTQWFNKGVQLHGRENEAETARKLVAKYTKLVKQRVLGAPSRIQSRGVYRAVEILQKLEPNLNGSTMAKVSLSAKAIRDLISGIEPFIFGNTPMCKALRLATTKFGEATADTTKVLVIITDGEATDGDPSKYASTLQELGVTTFVCILTSNNIQNPRRLLYEPQPSWTRAQNNMCTLSSRVRNTHSAFAALLEQKWELPQEGESRLFVQANHPDIVEEFTEIVRRLAESSDAALNILGRLSLDEYINKGNAGFRPVKQIGGTCYAHAVATVFHLAMRRIEGRAGGVPEFGVLRDELILAYGDDGARTVNVLQEWSPKYRLHFVEVDEAGARRALNQRRPLVARFSLGDEQWKAFSDFYETSPSGILETQHLGVDSADPGGHAVVLIGADPQCLTLMNSWGTNWGDGGFFRVRNQAVLNLTFYDVYWTLNDLKPEEITAYDARKLLTAEQLADRLSDRLKRLQYKCPKCGVSSPANTFQGHFDEAQCPKCHRRFKPTPIGLDLHSYGI